MTIELIEREPSSGQVFVVMIGGVERGEVVQKPLKYGGILCHAVLNVPGCCLAVGLAQGFGETPGEAIAAAFRDGREDAQQYLAALERLETDYRQGGAA